MKEKGLQIYGTNINPILSFSNHLVANIYAIIWLRKIFLE